MSYHGDITIFKRNYIFCQDVRVFCTILVKISNFKVTGFFHLCMSTLSASTLKKDNIIEQK